MTRPLPEDVARTARAYLATLVPPGEVSDAWHELVADVTYWGDRELVAVVRMAHQVVLGHQRVAPEVAVLALRDLGLDQPPTVARVLDVDEDVADRWTREVAASLGDGPAGDTDAPDDAGDTDAPDDPADTDVPDDPADTGVPDEGADDTGARREPDGDTGVLRIGLGEQDSWPARDDLDSPASTTPRWGMVAAVVVVAVLLALLVWWLGR